MISASWPSVEAAIRKHCRYTEHLRCRRLMVRPSGQLYAVVVASGILRNRLIHFGSDGSVRSSMSECEVKSEFKSE